MGNILGIVLKVLGFNQGQSTTNAVSGIVNYSWLIPALGWLYLHRFDIILINAQVTHNGKTETFQILQSSMGFISIVVIGAFIYVETLRRSRNTTGQTSIQN